MSQVDVYPSPTFPAQSSSSSSSSHSDGSFSPVLIVLAVIFVLVVVSVVLGRICNRRYHSSKGEHSHSKVGGKKSKQKDKFHHHHHPQQHPAGDGDIEFGFDKRIASSKVASNGDHHFNFKAPRMPHGGGEPRGPAVRFADDHIEFRTGA